MPAGVPRAVSAVCALFVFAGGLVSLGGWIWDVPRLTDWWSDGISIQPNTALAATFAAAALLFLPRGSGRTAATLGAGAAAISALNVLQHATGADLGIDRLLLFDREWGMGSVVAPGRMGLPASLSWTLVGVGVVIAARAPAARVRLVPYFALIPAAIALLGFVGHLYGAKGLFALPHVTAIAFQTGSFVLLTSVSLLAAVPASAPVQLILDRSEGGILVRRIAPAILCVPIVFGFLRLLGERAGLYDAAFGSALRTIVEIALLAGCLAWTATAIRRHSAQRSRADAELLASRERLETELSDARLLQTVSTQLVVEQDPRRFDETVVQAAARLMRSDFASMQMLHPERGARGELRLLAFVGFDPEAAALWEWVRVDSGCSCGAALSRGERVIVSDVAASDFLADEHRVTYRRLGIVAMQSTPLVSRAGKVLGMISTHWRVPHQPGERELRLLDILSRQAADLVERRQLEQQRVELLDAERAARTDAERAGRLKDEFLATLSHELRTPLNAIIGWSQLLRRDVPETGDVRYAIDVIERNARLQAKLVTDLLDVSRIVAGNMRLDMQHVDLASVVHAVVESTLPAAQARGVVVAVELSSDARDVRGDPARLQQVAWNLLSNAVKFTPRGGRVTVKLARANGHVELSVADTGEGIEPEFLPHVFERFRQADASASRSHGGLGLGLAIVKQLVELHGGVVRASSAGIGRGATFTIELPLPSPRTESAPPPERVLAASHVETAATLPFGGKHVLVVDDDVDSLAIVRRLLTVGGAHVSTESSVASALVRLTDTRFDVVLSDIGMPGRDGYEFIREVRARGHAVPAVALTAFARAEDRARALAAGYQEHLAKPIDAEELHAAVANLLERTRVS